MSKGLNQLWFSDTFDRKSTSYQYNRSILKYPLELSDRQNNGHFPKTHIIFKAGKEEAIKTHKGFQSLNIAEIPSFQQHEANQRAISKVAYREDWDEEKGKKRFYAV